MIMIIAIIYIFSILCDIWSTVENYFQKILSFPPKKSTPPFLLIPPSKNSKSASLPLFANIGNFSAPSPPCRKGGRHYVIP